MSALYNHYTVLRSRITVERACSSTNPQISAMFIEDDTSTVTAGDVSAAAERPGAVRIMSIGYAAGAHKLSLSWDATKYFGSNPLGNDNLQGTGSTSPSEQMHYLLVGYFPSLDSVSEVIFVNIEYDVCWDELKTIASS